MFIEIGFLGIKINMTQIFDLNGMTVPITIIKCEPGFITQIKTNNICGYNAIQLGYFRILPTKLCKTEIGHFLKNKLPFFSYLKEYKISDVNNFEIGQKFDINLLQIGQKIKISGIIIGKGYLGNIKKNHFSIGPMSHGSKHHRLQGSLGAGTSPGRVFPGKKMSGRKLKKRCTISSLKLINIDKERNLLSVKGAIPGKVGSLVEIITL